MPNFCCTTAAVAGKVMSGVVVATTIRSTSAISMPAFSIALRPAAAARSEVFSPSAAMSRPSRREIRCGSRLPRRAARSSRATRSVRRAAIFWLCLPGAVIVGFYLVVIGSYHPSRQNTNTGKLTPRMMSDVFRTARKFLAR